VAAGQLGLTGGAQPIFFPKSTKTSIQLLLEAQQHKKYAQTTPLDDGISSLFTWKSKSTVKGLILIKDFFLNKKKSLFDKICSISEHLLKFM
jgi:hypothetical protein